MRAVRFHGVGEPLSVEDVDRPRPGPGQVPLDVAAAGVCGTELHFLDGLLTPARTPITLGHEVAGVVAELGEGIAGIAVGDRVGWSWPPTWLDDLRAGRVVGRAVLVP